MNKKNNKKEDLKRYEQYHKEYSELEEILGIKFAPVEQTLAVYPDEFMGLDFAAAKGFVKDKFSKYTAEKLIKAFRSHKWRQHSDIYGHNGLTGGWSCLKCKRSVKLPYQAWNKETKTSYFSDEYILAFHFIYGHQKRFGGRITKCKGKKRKKNV